MIYFNQTRLPLNFTTKDGVVFEINSNRKPEELLETLLKGEDISEISNITTYLVIDPGVSKFNPKNLHVTYNTRKVGDPVPNYDMSYNEDYDGDEDPFVPLRKAVPFMNQREEQIFNDFEGTTFGRTDTAIKFQVLTEEYFNEHPAAKNVFRTVLINQLAASCNIAPYLINLYPDLDIKEYKSLSHLVETTYDETIADFYSDGHDNGTDKWLPEKETLDVLRKMNKAERSLLETDAGLPIYNLSVTKVADLIYKTKSDNPKVLATLDTIWNKKPVNSRSYSEDKYKSFKQKLSDAFIEKFNFVPRVIDDYARVWGIVTDYDESKINAIIDTFNRGSLSKCAAFKNLPLYAICNDINLNETKQEHIEIIGVYYPVQQLAKIPEFIKYYKKYKDDLSEEQLKTICHYIRDYETVLGLYTPYGRHASYNNAGKMLDLDKTPAEIIEYYNNAYSISQKALFEDKYHFSFDNNDLAIKGRNIEVTNGNYTMKMLQKDDLDLFVTGRDTNCCTEFSSPGESCVKMAISDPLHTFCAIYSKSGRMIVSAYTWVDIATDTLVFDNMEFHNDAKVSSFEPVIAEFVDKLPYANVHVGTGYNTNMSGWGKKLTYGATMPRVLDPGCHVYSDYHENNARALKIDGRVTIKLNPANITVIEKELVPSTYDEIINSGIGYLLGTGKPLDEIRQLASKIEEGNLTDDEIKDIITSASPSAELMDRLPVLSEPVQLWFSEKYPSKLELIKNPCDTLAMRQIEKDPLLISKIENPSENLLKLVVQKNGLYLSQIKTNITYDVCKEAVAQNGYAYSLVPAEFRTDEIRTIAIEKAPRSILSMEVIPENILNLALSSDPSLATLIESVKGPIPETVQINLARRDPSSILGLETISFEAMKIAVESNGMFIRNCYKRFPELIEVAIRQNPKSISVIPKPTIEQARLAISLDNSVRNSIRDPEVIEALNHEAYEEEEELIGLE